MGRARKLVWSSIFGVVELVLTTGISLFMMPFSIAHLGERMYGLWLLVGNLSGFYGLFDLGLSSAVQRYWSRALGLENYEEANEVFNSSLVFFSLIGVVVFLISIGVSLSAPIFFKDVHDIVTFRRLIVIVGFGLAFSFPMRTFWASYAVHLKAYLNSYIAMVQLIVRTILIIIFLLEGYKLLTFALIIITTDILTFLVLSIVGLRIAPYIKVRRKYIKFSRIKAMFGYSVYAFIGQVAMNIGAASDNFVIAGFIGLQSIPMYAVASRLQNYYTLFIQRIAGTVMPVFSSLEAQNNHTEIKERFWFFSRISAYSASLIAGLLVILGKPFIICWMGEGYSDSYEILLLLTVSAFITLSQIPAQQLLFGISKHKVMAWVNLVGAFLNLVISIILVPEFGLMGVAFGTLLSTVVVRLVVLPVYVSRQIKENVWSYYGHFFKIFLLSMSVLLAIYWKMAGIVQANYLSLGGCALITCIIFLGIVFLFGFDRNERFYLVRAITKK